MPSVKTPVVTVFLSFVALQPAWALEELRVFEIAAETVPCVSVAPTRCLVVNEKLFYDTIAGYRHIEGQAAKICVLRSKRPEPVPADVGAFAFEKVPCDN